MNGRGSTTAERLVGVALAGDELVLQLAGGAGTVRVPLAAASTRLRDASPEPARASA